MLEDLLAALHNWFVVDVRRGAFTVTGGGIDLDFVRDGQYFRVRGSVFNDGLHKYPATDMTDETFEGEVWALAVPKAVQDLATEIEAWCKDHQESVYTSESFGGYSYSKATDANGAPMDWRGAFRSKMARWRKIA